MKWQRLLAMAAVTIVLAAPAAIAGTVTNNGTIRVSGDLAVDWDISGSGSFTGSGSMTLSGSFNPGNSPGTATLDVAETTFADDHTLIIEFASESGSTVHDLLIVGANSTLTLGGTLALDFFQGDGFDLLDPSTLSVGDTFDIITASEGGTINGTFAYFDQSNAPLLSNHYWSVLYGDNVVSLSVEQTPPDTLQSPIGAPVPEGETWLLLSMAVIGIAFRNSRPLALLVGK